MDNVSELAESDGKGTCVMNVSLVSDEAEEKTEPASSARAHYLNEMSILLLFAQQGGTTISKPHCFYCIAPSHVALGRCTEGVSGFDWLETTPFSEV